LEVYNEMGEREILFPIKKHSDMKSYFNLKCTESLNRNNLLAYFDNTRLFFVILISLFLFTTTAMGQEASTTVNIVLADVFSIDSESNAIDGSVNFTYNSVEDYNSEQTVTIANSLVLTFSKPFDIKVRADGAYFENGDHKIPVNVITIRPNESSTVTGTPIPVELSSSDQVLIESSSLGSKLHLDLDYIIPQSRASSNDILGKPAGNYTQIIVFTATAI